MKVRRAAAGAVLALLVLTGCGEDAQQAGRDAGEALDRAGEEASQGVERAQEELDKVDWDKHGRQVKRRLDRLAERADCRGLKAELARAEGNDTALTAYIKERIRQASC